LSSAVLKFVYQNTLDSGLSWRGKGLVVTWSSMLVSRTLDNIS